jgi:hypothetical protein
MTERIPIATREEWLARRFDDAPAARALVWVQAG